MQPLSNVRLLVIDQMKMTSIVVRSHPDLLLASLYRCILINETIGVKYSLALERAPERKRVGETIPLVMLFRVLRMPRRLTVQI